MFWAKTIRGDLPGISVRDHCLNVGCVAGALISGLPATARTLLPAGSATLAALHDIGKITLGFQVKAPGWLAGAGLGKQAGLEAPYSVSDHALVSQVYLQELLKPDGAQLWAVAVGSHHGRPKGRSANLSAKPEALKEWARGHRLAVVAEIVEELGHLPKGPPDVRFGDAHSDLWLLAGLVTVADWIGSNEAFFSPAHGHLVDQTRRLATDALGLIGWPGGALLDCSFRTVFGFDANTVQKAVADSATSPGLFLVEAPMGCGKTEAALRVAQQLIAGGHHHGLYFALPTQVTSNRIHRRIAAFLGKTLADPAQLRLAHANAWLEDDFDLRLTPSFPEGKKDDESAEQTVHEARSWFASAKQALLAPYGVGTIDQALQGVVAVKHFFVRRFALAGKVVILDEIHSYDIYTGTLITALVRELIHLGCTVIVLSATLTAGRRRELLAAGRCVESDAPASYPLITVGTADASARHYSPEWTQSRQVTLRAEAVPEAETVEALVARADAGQHVLWIRNTVIEAQEAFRAVRSTLREGDLPSGLLHSRFPFARRKELEDNWLERLGRQRPEGGSGSILIATQVVEQSVDIDLDFIVSDLAPTDMLLQRMGRLWRHERPARAVGRPEFWVRLPQVEPAAAAKGLKRALGRSARVYAPYVLLRTAEIWQARDKVDLPADIRPLLEATYADSSPGEPDSWRELREELEAEKGRLAANAEAAMRVLGNPVLPDADEVLTRRKGPPTMPVLLLRSVVSASSHIRQLAALDDSCASVSEHDWSMASARFIHRWLVRVPRWQVPGDAPRPRWLALHTSGDATCACVRDDGRLVFGETVAATSYHPDFGVFADKPVTSRPQPASEPWSEDDDEFDS